MTVADAPYDALLVVGFGGPEKPEDVLPFLENVLRGRNVPREQMLEVAAHYEHFDGRSPINDQMRDLIAALRPELAAHGIHLPIYWGNRNWHPLLAGTLCEMTASGVQRALTYVASAYSSYSGCRQYLGDIDRAREVAGPSTPRVDKLRVFFNHPQFIAASASRLADALQQLPWDRRGQSAVIFTAHSIPAAMAGTCQYEPQLRETCGLVAAAAGLAPSAWQLVYQSRSGRPEDPWLGPDVCDHLRTLPSRGTTDVILMPIGFLSDHMEVQYDLDYEARQVCDELGLRMVRAATVGTHPLFVRMLRELIEERLSGSAHRASVGSMSAWPDLCPSDCCPAGARSRT